MVKSVLVYLTHPHVRAWNFQLQHRDLLKELVPGLEVETCYRSGEFLERLPEAEAVVVWYFKKEWLLLARRLRWIATPAAGTDWIGIDTQSDIQVCHGGFHGGMMAESVLGAMLYFCKAFDLSFALQRQHKWARVKISDRIQSLNRARVTILGFGRIGQAIARRLKLFGCILTGVKHDPMISPDFFSESDRVVTVDRLAEVLPTTDHLVVVLPGGIGTDGLLTRDHFAQLQRTTYFYNVGRGNAYREQDLVDALRSGEIAGAYLDVFETEPLPEQSSLWGMNNVLLQPHLSAASPQYLEYFVRELADRINKGELGQT